MRTDAASGARSLRLLEDGPAYARTLVATRLGGHDVVAMHETLEPAVDAIDYADIVDETTFETAVDASSESLRAIVAARIGRTRLIDNAAIPPAADRPSDVSRSPEHLKAK